MPNTCSIQRAAILPLLALVAVVFVACANAPCDPIDSSRALTANDDDRDPINIVIAIAEPEYKTSQTLPALAEKLWTNERGYEVTIVRGDPTNHDMPGLIEALDNADVLVLSVRRQVLPKAQLQAVRDYLDRGKPLLAIRTSSHAFALRNSDRNKLATDKTREQWPQFDAAVLGGNYHGHHPNGKPSTVTVAPGAEKHFMLARIRTPFTTNAGLYKNAPLAETADPILIATPNEGNHPPEPVAWTHRYGKQRAKIFYTSLGNARDFEQPAFEQLMDNAMDWLRDKRAQSDGRRRNSGKSPGN